MDALRASLFPALTKSGDGRRTNDLFYNNTLGLRIIAMQVEGLLQLRSYCGKSISTAQANIFLLARAEDTLWPLSLDERKEMVEASNSDRGATFFCLVVVSKLDACSQTKGQSKQSEGRTAQAFQSEEQLSGLLDLRLRFACPGVMGGKGGTPVSC